MEFILIIILLLIGLAAATEGSLLGSGGGFILTPILVFMGYNKMYIISGSSPPEFYLVAPVLSLFVIIFIAISATAKNAGEKTINYRLGLVYAPFSITGAFVGSEILLKSGLINPFIFKIIFSVLIVIIGIKLIMQREQSNSESEFNPGTKKWAYHWVFFLGFVTGFIASIIGIGGGTIAVPIIHFFFLEAMNVAIATSLFIMIFTASFSTLWNCLNLAGILDINFFLVGFIIVIGAIIGAQFGSRIKTRLKNKTLELLFGFVIIGIAFPLVWLSP